MTTQNKSTLLVTGASGFVGSGLCRLAAENGHGVIALSRSPENADLPSAQSVEAWQPDIELIPSSTLSNCGAVVHLAGETIGARWNPDKKRRIRESRVNSTNRLVESSIESRDKAGGAGVRLGNRILRRDRRSRIRGGFPAGR